VERAEKTSGAKSSVQGTQRPGPASAGPAAAPLSPLGLIQRFAGNRAAGQVLHRCGPEPCECSAGKQREAAAYAGIPVSHPNDPAERDADRAADEVLRLRDDELGPVRAHHPEDDGVVYRSASHGTAAPALAAPVRAAFAAGQPLDAVTRAWFEPRFGMSLDGVRVHTGPAAADSARELAARAYTVGSDIAFGAGEYAPGTPGGRRLLAHELAHVVAPAGPGVYRQPAPADTFHDRDKGPVRPNSKSYTFQGVDMTTDPAYTRRELKLLVRRFGIKGLELWYGVLHGTRTQITLPFSAYGGAFGGQRVRNPMDAQRDMANDAVRGEIGAQAVAVVDKIYPEVLAEAQAFRASFQRSLRRSLEHLLRESELRIRTQRMRYGLRADPAHPDEVVAADTVSFRAVVGAAQDLLVIRRRVDRLRGEQYALLEITNVKAGTTRLPERNRARYDELGKQAAEIEKTYDDARVSAASRHPALGAVLDDAGAAATFELENLATGDRRGTVRRIGRSRGTAAGLEDVMRSRERSIGKVREKADGDPELLWALPEIVALTKAVLGTDGNIMADGIIKEKLDELQFEEALKSSFLLVAQLALLIPTGGTSLAGTAALSGYQAARSVDNYRYQSALASTDLNKRAYAIAAEDPSLAWVALDVAFAILDAKAALHAFRELRPLARAALLGKEADAAALATRADGLGQGLGKRLLDRLAVLRKRPEAVRLLGAAGEAEVKAVAEAAETIGREANAAERIAGVAGHDVKVTKSGALVVCSECMWLRERFATELAGNPALSSRMATAEAKARAGALDAASKAEVGALTTELQRLRETRLVAEFGPAAAKAAAAGDARAAYETVLRRRPTLDRELTDLERRLAAAPTLNPADAARVDRLTAQLERLRAIDTVSVAPRNGRIVEVSLDRTAANYFENVASVVPGPPVVLEFPDGSRVWRDAVGGPIRHESTLGGSLGRAGTENAKYATGAHGNLPAGPKYERAHTSGQGTGFESPYAIYYAPEYVNQTLQNQGIETYLRDITAGAAPGESFRVVTRTQPHPDTLRLATIDYRILRQTGDRVEEIASYSIVVSSSAEHPVVSAGVLRFAPTSTGRAMATRFTIPPPLTGPASFAY
jgi:hypothetical protein